METQVETMAEMHRTAYATLQALQAHKDRVRQRAEAVEDERSSNAIKDPELFRRLSQTMLDLRTELERLDLAIASASDANQAAANASERARHGEREARLASAVALVEEGLAQSFGFLAQFYLAVGKVIQGLRVAKAVEDEIKQANRSLSDRRRATYKNTVGTSLLTTGAAFVAEVATMKPERLTRATPVIKQLKDALCTGAALAPYTATIPYPDFRQFTDLMSGAYNARARDFESRPAHLAS